MSGSAGNFVVLGKLAEAYGLDGWLRVHAFGDDPLAWKSMPLWWLRDERADADWRPYALKQCRARGDSVIVSLDGIDDRTAAEGLKGWLVGAPREALPATATDEYYWGDLIGLAVVNTDDRLLGEVAGLIETGANAVLRVVDAGGAERLLPFVGSVVLTVDTAGRRILVAWGEDW